MTREKNSFLMVFSTLTNQGAGLLLHYVNSQAGMAVAGDCPPAFLFKTLYDFILVITHHAVTVIKRKNKLIPL